VKFCSQGLESEIISIPFCRKQIAEECLIFARCNRLKKRSSEYSKLGQVHTSNNVYVLCTVCSVLDTFLASTNYKILCYLGFSVLSVAFSSSVANLFLCKMNT